MRVGIGLPTTIPGVGGERVVEWARRAEARGLSSLGTIDRLVFGGYEPLVALAAAAAATERITLATTVLISPLHVNAALLAKQISSLDRISAGRLTLGLGVGARDDDYAASGLEARHRGRTLERQVAEMRRVWAGEERGHAGAIGPPPMREGGPPILTGARGEQAMTRAARVADGWIMGAVAPVSDFSTMSASLDRAWAAAGRRGRPRKLACRLYSLGAQARENAQRYVGDYYDLPGPPPAETVIGRTVTSAPAVREVVGELERGGCEEVIFFPCSSDLDQVELLVDAVAPCGG